MWSSRRKLKQKNWFSAGRTHPGLRPVPVCTGTGQSGRIEGGHILYDEVKAGQLEGRAVKSRVSELEPPEPGYLAGAGAITLARLRLHLKKFVK